MAFDDYPNDNDIWAGLRASAGTSPYGPPSPYGGTSSYGPSGSAYGQPPYSSTSTTTQPSTPGYKPYDPGSYSTGGSTGAGGPSTYGSPASTTPSTGFSFGDDPHGLQGGNAGSYYSPNYGSGTRTSTGAYGGGYGGSTSSRAPLTMQQGWNNLGNSRTYGYSDAHVKLASNNLGKRSTGERGGQKGATSQPNLLPPLPYSAPKWISKDVMLSTSPYGKVTDVWGTPQTDLYNDSLKYHTIRKRYVNTTAQRTTATYYGLPENVGIVYDSVVNHGKRLGWIRLDDPSRKLQPMSTLPGQKSATVNRPRELSVTSKSGMPGMDDPLVNDLVAERIASEYGGYLPTPIEFITTPPWGPSIRAKLPAGSSDFDKDTALWGQPERVPFQGITAARFPYSPNPNTWHFYGGYSDIGKNKVGFGNRLGTGDRRIAAFLGAPHPGYWGGVGQGFSELGDEIGRGYDVTADYLGNAFGQIATAGIPVRDNAPGMGAIRQTVSQPVSTAIKNTPRDVVNVIKSTPRVAGAIGSTFFGMNDTMPDGPNGQTSQEAFRRQARQDADIIQGLTGPLGPLTEATGYAAGGQPTMAKSEVRGLITGELSFALEHPLIGALNAIPDVQGIARLSEAGIKFASKVGATGMERLADKAFADATMSTDPVLTSKLYTRAFQYYKISSALRHQMPLRAVNLSLGHDDMDWGGQTISEATGYKSTRGVSPSGTTIDLSTYNSPTDGTRGEPRSVTDKNNIRKIQSKPDPVNPPALASSPRSSTAKPTAPEAPVSTGALDIWQQQEKADAQALGGFDPFHIYDQTSDAWKPTTSGKLPLVPFRSVFDTNPDGSPKSIQSPKPDNDVRSTEKPSSSSSPIPGSYVNPKYRVDMRSAPPKSPKTALGHPRNNRWFWRQLLKSNPELFSPANRWRISHGKGPIIDDTWVKRNPTHAGFSGDKLIHHHEGQGYMATPLPKSVHHKWTKVLHPFQGA